MTLLFAVISVTLLGLWAARALTAPLSAFAKAAESFSLDGDAAALPERGPEEIRSVACALNRMRERITALIEAGKARGDLAPDTDTNAAVTMFIGTIQGLIMQALLGGDIGRIQAEARRAFVIYRRGIGGGQ